MLHGAAPGTPTLLFGTFDRHHCGDLLVPHILVARATDQPKLHPLIYLSRTSVPINFGHLG